jgi:hypothetical protein
MYNAPLPRRPGRPTAPPWRGFAPGQPAPCVWHPWVAARSLAAAWGRATRPTVCSARERHSLAALQACSAPAPRERRLAARAGKGGQVARGRPSPRCLARRPPRPVWPPPDRRPRAERGPHVVWSRPCPARCILGGSRPRVPDSPARIRPSRRCPVATHPAPWARSPPARWRRTAPQLAPGRARALSRLARCRLPQSPRTLAAPALRALLAACLPPACPPPARPARARRQPGRRVRCSSRGPAEHPLQGSP